MINLDQQLFNLIYSLSGRWALLDALILFCARYLIFIIIGLIIGWWLNLQRIRESDHWPVLSKKKLLEFGHLSLSVIVAFLINQLIGLFYFRPRPFVTHLNVHQLVNPLGQKSFPSDHTTVAFVLAMAVYSHHKPLGRVLIFLAMLVGFGRIAAGVHYPLDVLGGAIMGIIVALVIYYLLGFKKENKI